MSTSNSASCKGIRRKARKEEFDLDDRERRERPYPRQRARSVALLRSRAQATSTAASVSGASQHVVQMAGDCAALVPALGTAGLPLTKHAMHRLRNRGITMEQVMAVSLFGKEQRTCGGATKHYLDKRSRQLLSEELSHDAIRALGKLDIVAVVNDGVLITAAHRTRRTRND